jgi:hypothetical protein
MFRLVNTVTQHTKMVHRAVSAHKKIEEGHHKNINNDALKSTNGDACSIIDLLHKKEK